MEQHFAKDVKQKICYMGFCDDDFIKYSLMINEMDGDSHNYTQINAIYVRMDTKGLVSM